jgi:hypothetical protein
MRTILKSAAAAFASFAMIGQAAAADICARPDEAMALKAAALQQELMVAALTCDDVGAYNHFVVSHQRELQESDAALLGYFQRASAHAGADNYNAYKTKLANVFSLASLREHHDYCYTADSAFNQAFGRGGSLAMFIASEQVEAPRAYAACGDAGEQSEAVAGGSSATRLAASARN